MSTFDWSWTLGQLRLSRTSSKSMLIEGLTPQSKASLETIPINIAFRTSSHMKRSKSFGISLSQEHGLEIQSDLFRSKIDRSSISISKRSTSEGSRFFPSDPQKHWIIYLYKLKTNQINQTFPINLFHLFINLLYLLNDY